MWQDFPPLAQYGHRTLRPQTKESGIGHEGQFSLNHRSSGVPTA
jgi:hypothetical protein